jgi:hypothetical protein
LGDSALTGNNRPLLGVLLSVLIIISVATSAFGANVTLRWDANNPAPEGYRVFARESGQPYHYNHPIWESNQTTCTLIGLTQDVTYHFVVRAFDGNLESADSQEVSYVANAPSANQEPLVGPGQNQTVYERAMVVLDGSGSVDVDGTITAYRWVQTAGIPISLNDSTTAQASFTAPVVGMTGETLRFRLTVTDDDGSTSAATTTVDILKSPSTDVDGDHVPDVFDRFPDDPSEWADTDHDGIGDNQDTDDDNDGMTDSWELSYGLDPLSNDADQDADGDGVSNIDEFEADTNPTAAPGNTGPDAPVVDTDVKKERSGLTPVLVAGDYFDTDNDSHYQSRWQISTEANFATLILDETCHSQLTAYRVGPMVLDTDTAYYWRVKYIDERRGASQWSPSATFTTLAAHNSDDTDSNGIPDAQEVGPLADVDEDGIPDCQEANMMSVNTVEGQTMVGVEALSEDASLVSVKSLATDSISDALVKMEFGLIGFKLYLNSGVTRATVRIHFSTQVSRGARLYKDTPDKGWQVYDNAVFSANRKSVTLMLVDGGVGDEDGVENGVIVDPSGIAYTADSAAMSTGQATMGGGGGRACFISAAGANPVQPSAAVDSRPLALIAVVLAIICLTGAVALQYKKTDKPISVECMILLTAMNGSRRTPIQKVGLRRFKFLPQSEEVWQRAMVRRSFSAYRKPTR